MALAEAEGFSSEVDLPDHDLRAAVVDGLFAAASRLDRQFGHTYAGLTHSGLPQQITNGLGNPDPDVRRLAIRLARDCEAVTVHDALVDVALDPAELDDIRVTAGYTVIDLEGNNPTAALLPLLRSDAARGADSYDELFGVGLRACWPHTLNTVDVFDLLKTPARRNFRGAYAGFLFDFAERLSDDALQDALNWISRQGDGPVGELAVVYDSVLRLTVKNLPNALSKLIEIVKARSMRHEAFFADESSGDVSDPFDDQDRRRTLIAGLVDSDADDGTLRWLASASTSSVRILRAEDLGWIIESCAAASPDHRPAWSTLFGLAYRDDDRQHLDLILDMDTSHPLYDVWVRHWVEPVPIHGPVADRQREQRRMWAPARRPAPEEPDRFDGFIHDWLDRLEAGDIAAFWQAVFLVRVRPGTDRHFNENIPDLTAHPRWKRMSQETRDRFVDGAASYLRSRLCDPQAWLGQRIWHRPSRAGYQALVLLLRVRPGRLDELSPDDWREWAPAIAAWPVATNGAKSQDKEQLITAALPYARPQLIDALKAGIDSHIDRGEPAFVALEAGLVWNDDLGQHVQERLRQRISGPAHQELLRILLKHDAASARTLLLSYLTPEAIETSAEDATLAAATLLDHDAAVGLSTFLTLTRERPELASRVLVERDSMYALSVPPGTPDQLADLYVWLASTYPPAEDPDYDDVHAIGPREEIGNWRNAVLDRLMLCGEPTAPAAIRRVASAFSADRWLARVEATAGEAVRRAQWSPIGIADLRRFAIEHSSRVVRNTAELQSVVIEALHKIQRLLQGANPQSHLLWDTIVERPKDEDDLSDYLEGQLTSHIGGRGIVINREVQVRRTSRRGIGQRVDLHIAAADPAGGPTLIVIVEVKCAWNAGLFKDMRDQLANRYLTDVGSRHGVYCVGWYSTTQWERQKGGFPP